MGECIAVGGACGKPAVMGWSYCARHLQADQVAARLREVEAERNAALAQMAVLREALADLVDRAPPCAHPAIPQACCFCHARAALASTEQAAAEFVERVKAEAEHAAQMKYGHRFTTEGLAERDALRAELAKVREATWREAIEAAILRINTSTFGMRESGTINSIVGMLRRLSPEPAATTWMPPITPNYWRHACTLGRTGPLVLHDLPQSIERCDYCQAEQSSAARPIAVDDAKGRCGAVARGARGVVDGRECDRMPGHDGDHMHHTSGAMWSAPAERPTNACATCGGRGSLMDSGPPDHWSAPCPDCDVNGVSVTTGGGA